MTARTHCLIFLGVLTSTALLRLGCSEHYRNDLRLAAGKATILRADEIESEWKRRNYCDLRDERTKALILAKLQGAFASLSDAQSESLKVRLYEVLRYLEHPNFDEYLQMSVQGLDYQLIPGERAEKALQKLAKNGTLIPDPVGGNEREIVKMLWDNAHAQSREISRISAVSLESVSGAVTTNNSGWLLLRGPVKKGFTVAVEALNPGFVYDSSGISSSNSQFFEFSFLAKSGTETAGPLHVSLQWLPQHNKWAVNRLLGDAWLKFDNLF